VLVVHETTSKLEHTILTILLFAGAEITDKCLPRILLSHHYLSPMYIQFLRPEQLELSLSERRNMGLVRIEDVVVPTVVLFNYVSPNFTFIPDISLYPKSQEAQI
jgi:hypothetical protein